MNIELYKKYGNYSDRGKFILDFEKYDYYQHHPKERRRKTILAYCCLCIPIVGIMITGELFSEMGEIFM